MGVNDVSTAFAGSSDSGERITEMAAGTANDAPQAGVLGRQVVSARAARQRYLFLIELPVAMP